MGSDIAHIVRTHRSANQLITTYPHLSFSDTPISALDEKKRNFPVSSSMRHRGFKVRDRLVPPDAWLAKLLNFSRKTGKIEF